MLMVGVSLQLKTVSLNRNTRNVGHQLLFVIVGVMGACTGGGRREGRGLFLFYFIIRSVISIQYHK